MHEWVYAGSGDVGILLEIVVRVEQRAGIAAFLPA
jgi:hypothetical protein